MLALLRSLHQSTQHLDGEARHIIRLLRTTGTDAGVRVLDVGCGYGRMLRLMISSGWDAAGVEINPEIVEANRKAGLRCWTAEEFKQSTEQFDVILMAHVIEHFSPADLLAFMDSYLDRLKPGGRLIVATPLMSDYFYDDFDHVKPYQPTGILMVFGDGAAQVQYYARNRLALRDIWFRRSPLRISHSRSRYVRSPWRFALIALDFIAAVAYLVSARSIGKTNGWVGVFEKQISAKP
ncbi:MAG: class I SAM-dependent methyltransferase [Betaproteobacteria bacterium]|nr:class I SAM-dependent methyltransferase [Betaproteobacteria bacterium]